MPHIVPRDYQIQAISEGIDYFQKPSDFNALMVLPTGSGKSIIIANIAKELKGGTIIFQPSKEILEQNFAKYISYGYHAGIYSASFNRKEVRNVTFATIGSVKSNPHLFRDFPNVIIDESHLVNPERGMYKDFISNLKGAKLLGLTATPYRLHSSVYGGMLKFLTRTRPKIFDKVIYHVQNKTLFDSGYLSKMNYYSIGGFDRSQVAAKGSEFDDQSLKLYYERITFSQHVESIVNRLLKAGRKSILVFTKLISESEHLVKSIPDCELVTSETPPKERERIIRSFRNGRLKAVCNVGVLTTGFDYPELSTIVLARPTMSLGLYYQMIGRGIRPHKDKEGCWVVDMCDNFRVFGKLEDLQLRLIQGKREPKWEVYSGNKQLTNVYYGKAKAELPTWARK
ncbi:MAG: DEAD/DEAH box helicase [Bacteroidetes bacterium]|nr:MAG: DEAD/DEAH box helicase [Bacteroidota bacterium]